MTSISLFSGETPISPTYPLKPVIISNFAFLDDSLHNKKNKKTKQTKNHFLNLPQLFSQRKIFGLFLQEF